MLENVKIKNKFFNFIMDISTLVGTTLPKLGSSSNSNADKEDEKLKKVCKYNVLIGAKD